MPFLLISESLSLAHQGCQVLFYGDEYQVNGAPFGDFISLIIDSLQDEDLNEMKMMFEKYQLSYEDTVNFYNQVCRKNPLENKKFLENFKVQNEFQKFFRETINSLPKIKKFEGYKLKKFQIMNSHEKNIGHFYEGENTFFHSTCIRPERWVSLKDIPQKLTEAFISAEDDDFYEHSGISISGLLRSIFNSLNGDIQGGSTLTQQTIKNLYFQCEKEKNSSEKIMRKLKEFFLVRKVEKEWGKNDVLEIYLNIIFFGNGAYGIDFASQKYFDKNIKNLNLAEIAMLASLPKAPSTLSSSDEFEKLKERALYVLNKMEKNGKITIDEKKLAETQITPLQYFPIKVKKDKNNHYLNSMKDFIHQEINLKNAREENKVHAHQVVELQELAENSLMRNLISFEKKMGRYDLKPFSQTSEIFQLENSPNWPSLIEGNPSTPPINSWKKSLILSRENKRIILGLETGEKVEIIEQDESYSNVKVGEFYWVQKQDDSWELLASPEVSGAVIIMNVHNGAVLSMVSSDPYQNWALHALRQPGSTIKPFVYLYALDQGLAPNHILADSEISLKTEDDKFWTPQNYKGENLGAFRNIRFGLEHSKNIMTAQLLNFLDYDTPMRPLREIIKLTKDFGIYCQDDDFFCQKNLGSPEVYFPFILGSEETNLMRIVAAFAQIANGGYKIKPSFIKEITDLEGNLIYEDDNIARFTSEKINVSEEAIFQLKSLLMGVLERGTGRALKKYSSYLAGKTGTSNDQKDAWFVSFGKTLAFGTWVGYPTPKTLGRYQTGGSLAAPIVKEIVDGTFEKKFQDDLYQNSKMKIEYPPLLQYLPQGVKEVYVDLYRGCFYNSLNDSPDAIVEYIKVSDEIQNIYCHEFGTF